MKARITADKHASSSSTAPTGKRSSRLMGEFLYIPASSLTGGLSGELRDGNDVIPLTWSAPALEEFVAAMDRIEKGFLYRWVEADSTPGATDIRMRLRGHA